MSTDPSPDSPPRGHDRHPAGMRGDGCGRRGFLARTGFGLGAMALGETGGVAWWAHAGGFAAGVAMIAWAMGAGWVRKK